MWAVLASLTERAKNLAMPARFASSSAYPSVVVTILVFHVGLLAWSGYIHFPCVDEVGHMPAGISHLAYERFDLFHANPPLVRMVAALPVVMAGAPLPKTSASANPWPRHEFRVGAAWMQGLGVDSLWYFRLARWAVLPFSVVGALICFFWAGELYGPRSALAALTLWCFCPTVLSHASCITPDATAAALGGASCYAFWHWLRTPTWPACLMCGLALGLAQGTKMSWLLLYFLLPAMAIALCPPALSAKSWRQIALQLGGMFAVSLAVLNSLYLWQGSFQKLRDYQFLSQALGGPLVVPEQQTSNRFANSWLGSVRVPLPAQYVLGFDRVNEGFEQGLPSYLRGEWRHGGWWYYYLYAMAIKIPLGTWLLLLIALVGSVWRRYWQRTEWLLLSPAVTMIVLVSSQTGFNHHLRYVLPAFPFLFIFASKAFSLSLRKPMLAGLSLAALAWSVASSLSVFPHGTAYFNEVVGGPGKGYLHLHFSNTDWGQDMTLMKDWIDAHPEAEAPKILAFNVAHPDVLGMRAERPNLWPPAPDDKGKSLESIGPQPGWFIISVNNLQGYSDYTGSRWGRSAEEFANDPSLRYFQEFEPVDRIGYTMFVYHVGSDECNRVRRILQLPALQD
jgi:hypothetical protein